MYEVILFLADRQRICLAGEFATNEEAITEAEAHRGRYLGSLTPDAMSAYAELHRLGHGLAWGVREVGREHCHWIMDLEVNQGSDPDRP